ncbi:hypothetical protein HUE67_03675 [Bifidobacterium longum subsp. infantis]|uniref:Sugar-binding protein n=1 Tax=Bifidobacterium longum subsp. infantis TaxID=1682 RepID=A0A7D5BWT7_BIFLI|nr:MULTISPECIES: hypothetical protein [Bifidobacterium]KAB1943535.1 hypothetical protein F8277_09895 [Bifidobacterium longum subsp. infantis]MED7620529.1 hypothetical protein [Bifidobacterium longum subsp. infantis]NQX50992.1 hypothetical protein [Bifidobacterium longum subsp. infantis]QKY13934.1 hypothetical protein EE567_009080 [Bifidobacterium longum subsp. infantis]UPT02147.1 hypothetical protein HUE63_02675 [Bifidobacterium longum subsp. infantis]
MTQRNEKSMGTDERPELNAESGSSTSPAHGDIVDTCWDIPPISFVDNAGSAASGDGNSTGAVADGSQFAFPSFDEVMEWPAAGAANTDGGASSPSDAVATAPMTFAAPDTAESAQSPQRDDNATLSLFAPVPEAKPQRDSATDDLSIDFSAIEQNPEPVEEPEGDRAAEVSRGGKGGKKKTKGIIISVIAALVVIAAIIGGVWYWRSSEQRQESHQLHQDALTACAEAVDQNSTAQKALAKALADAQSAQSITADQVADGATVDALKKAVAAVKNVEAVECKTSASTSDLKEYAKTATSQTKTAKKNATAITAAAKAVTDSKNAKDQANAQQALQGKIAEAQTLLDNSLYAVDDNSTRVTLESDIANANTVLSQQGTDVKAMQDAVNTLTASMDAVNTSMANYSAAVEAQQEAARQKALNDYYARLRQQQLLQQQPDDEGTGDPVAGQETKPKDEPKP